MNKQSAINLVKSTFENPYNTDRFLNFARNLFHSFEPATFVYRGNYIPDAYKKQIKTLERIGKFEDRDKNKIDILAVCLNQDSTLERARTLQRNFISWYLNGSRGDVTKDAALVAFYVEGSKDWRLSLVKMEYRLGKSDSGRLKTFTELTPAKRFSFLVGENENTHTAQKQLLPTLIKEDAAPTLSDLEKIFSVEVVTKEFFEKYKQLFLDTKEALDKIVKDNLQIQSDFNDKNIDTVDFTKKLLGQIVFLYFLQKKGWFGVARDEDWGTGPKEFLRLLFEKNVIDYDNYFNDILEPLFYEALAIERPDDFYSRFDCKIPFLNGGLFDPLNNYDWVHTDIHLPNHLFSNDNPTKEGDRGTGILDVFDRYNFTVKEDEPLEREVAVDPEMLGKVFENLLEVKDRKSKGTYYTPREIVHYMCQESLVNYLATELEGKTKKEDIETLVQIGEAAVEHDTRVTEIGEETPTYSYKLPQNIRDNAQLIDTALTNIRVCDPAVGSGAFLVGMMTEIIRVRNTISSYFVDGDRSTYAFKHHAIQHSLYGVDIDPGATEIAKLRLWLSLIVDEQDIKKIKPLPNLDYKIMQGNSLLEEFEGIKLFDEELFAKSAFDNTVQVEEVKTKMSELQREFFELYKNNQLHGIRKQQIDAELKKLSDRLKRLTKTPKPQIENGSLFDQVSEAQQKAKELKRLHKEFFNTSHKKEKDQIKKQIESLTWELIEATLREQGKESLMRQVEKYKKANIRPFFLWKLNYSEVFESKGGFDVIIANPPYVGQKGNNYLFQPIKKSGLGIFHQRRMDLFYFFFHQALNLGNDRSTISFITTNYYLTATYADKLRNDLKKRSTIKNLINFNELKIFESALGQHNIITIIEKNISSDAEAKVAVTHESGTATPEILQQIVRGIDNQTDYYQISQTDLYDGDECYIRLTGVNNKTPLDLVFEKLTSKSDQISNYCNITTGIQTGADKVTDKNIQKYNIQAQIGEGIFVITKREEDRIGPHPGNILKSWYKNSDIYKWGTRKNSFEDLIYYTSKSAINLNSAYLEHFKKFKRVLINRNTRSGTGIISEEDYDQFVKGNKYISYVMIASSFKEGKYYCVSYARDQQIFEGPKIVAPQRSPSNVFGYNEIPWYASADVYFITEKDSSISLKYVLGLLNSRLYYLWLYYRGKRKGETLELYQKPLSEIPIRIIPSTDQESIVQVVDKILSITNEEDYLLNQDKLNIVKEYESQIDQLVYKLYDLTPDDIAIVEGANNE